MKLKMEKRVDAKRAITLHVSRKAFRDATEGDPTRCAIAQECKKRFPGVETFYIGASTAFFYRGNVRTRYKLNNSARTAIQLFDKEKGWPAGKEIKLLPPGVHDSPAAYQKRMKRAGRSYDPRTRHVNTGIRRKQTLRGAIWLRGVASEKRVL